MFIASIDEKSAFARIVANRAARSPRRFASTGGLAQKASGERRARVCNLSSSHLKSERAAPSQRAARARWPPISVALQVARVCAGNFLWRWLGGGGGGGGSCGASGEIAGRQTTIFVVAEEERRGSRVADVADCFRIEGRRHGQPNASRNAGGRSRVFVLDQIAVPSVDGELGEVNEALRLAATMWRSARANRAPSRTSAAHDESFADRQLCERRA